MTKINQTVKAVRTTIKLGDITLDGYQMPDGCYKLSVAQAAKAANLDPKRVPQIWEKKELKALLPEGLSVPQTYIKAKVETLEGIRAASLIDLKYVSLLWLESNTPEGKALAHACMVESLERRLDAAFSVTKTEEQRNEVFALRMDMISSYHAAKKAINFAESEEHYVELSQAYKDAQAELTPEESHISHLMIEYRGILENIESYENSVPRSVAENSYNVMRLEQLATQAEKAKQLLTEQGVKVSAF